jgi:hypothetical protein
MPSSLSHGIGKTGGFLRREFDATWPVFLFFLTGFVLLILLIKLVLAEFSIEVRVVSTAVVGALFAAKAAIVLDDTPLARALESYRRIVAVAVKTFLYAAATILLGFVERLLEALHKVHSLGGAFQYVAGHANEDRLLAWVLGISIVFGLYFSFVEINQRMGQGALGSLFFESPPSKGVPIRSSKISPEKRPV